MNADLVAGAQNCSNDAFFDELKGEVSRSVCIEHPAPFLWLTLAAMGNHMPCGGRSHGDRALQSQAWKDIFKPSAVMNFDGSMSKNMEYFQNKSCQDYTLPQEKLSAVWDQYDLDKDGFLDSWELKELLANYALQGESRAEQERPLSIACQTSLVQ